MSVGRTCKIIYVVSFYNENYKMEIIIVIKSVHHGALTKL